MAIVIHTARKDVVVHRTTPPLKPNHQAGPGVSILTAAGEAKSLVRTCRTRWATSLTTTPDNFPIIPDVRVGDASGLVSLDTGSNGA